jgi:hypothetical protein
MRFHHADALENPKPNRPGVVDELRAGRYSVFYGSTFKRGGAPRGAVVADPNGPPEARDLARCLGRAVDERTLFHGSLVSEVEATAATSRVFPDGRCPNDVLDLLEEQGEECLLAFYEAWDRTRWLAPRVRAGLLQALWWRAPLAPRERLAFTLLLCDGWKLNEISSLRRVDVRAGTWISSGGQSRRLLPRTHGLLELWQADPDSTLGYGDIASELAPKWELLLNYLDGDQRRVCPKWDAIRQRA